ncbi:N-acetylglucosaminyltransferase [Geofilum rubicundum JCM 15548]|uniref:N-acetylglucosaminyltransferase n=1 Tax=Geofilum rubicundum JCM 15548 TaxID=1236989 RepID=A0A0E9LT24_9BACT|nr:N-acetylglucosaminyltransferase [Geofilum rubicundum JCM 15548]
MIVPYRNEAKTLPALLAALGQQNLSSHLFEVIAVNDHSEDGGENWLSGQNLFKGSLRRIDAQGQGKKSALKEGIACAKGPLIVTLDADCVPHRGWLKTLMDGFGQWEADMLIGPVKMRSSGSFLSRFESVDYWALQMSGAAAAMLGFPVFCSGANLAFKKSVWEEAVPHSSGTDVASGDDVFLLHAFKKLHKKICFLRHPSALVETSTSGSVGAFLRQRMRWGGKSTSYKDAAAIALAVIVFMANLWLLLLLAFWMLTGMPFRMFGLAFLLKVAADYFLLRQGRRLFDVRYSFLKHLLFSVMYPFGLVATAIGGLILPEKWK